MGDDLVTIGQALARIEQRQEDMHRQLFGNGQPGVIQKLEDRVDDHEKTIRRGQGIIAGIGAVYTVVWGVLEYLLHRGGR